jgi:hypothetical protein
MPDYRLAVRIWPGQFQDGLACQLLIRSMALYAALGNREALVAGEEGVAIYRGLAAARPAKAAGAGRRAD